MKQGVNFHIFHYLLHLTEAALQGHFDFCDLIFNFMLSPEEVKKIAELARIGLGKSERLKYQKELSAILGYFEKLNELNTDNIEPIGHITGRFNSTREDKRENLNEAEKEMILANAPEKKNKYIKVKSVM